MAKGRRVSGIFVPIQLDTSAVQRDMEGLGTQLSTSINKISRNLEGALNPKQILKGVVDLNKAMGELRDSSKIWQQMGDGQGKFEQGLRQLRPQLRDLAEQFGGTIKQQREMYTMLVQNQAVRQEVSALQTWQKQLGVTEEQVVELMKARGQLISAAALKEFLPETTIERAKNYKEIISKTAEEYRKLSQAAGTVGSQAGYEGFVKKGEISQAISSFKQLYDTTKMSREEVERLTQTSKYSAEILAAMFPRSKAKEFGSELGKVAAEYRKLAQAAGVAPSQAGYESFLSTQRISAAISAFERLNRGQQVTAVNFEQIARAANVSTAAVEKYVAASQKQKEASRGVLGIFTPSSVAAGAQSAMASMGVVGGMYGITELGKAMYNASLQMENFQLAFQSVYGSASKASAQLEFVRKISDELGISFAGTAQSAKQLFAAAKGTELEKDANQIFKAFSTMGSALKLSGDEMNSVFLAVSQIISKGKVSAEELRLQLAERMPGAVTLFAKSIGVTTKQLDDMLQKGEVGLDSLKKFAVEVEKTYTAGARSASSGLQAEINRVGNAWFDLKRSFIGTDSSARALATVTDSLKAITAVAPQVAATVSVIGKFAVLAGGVALLAKAFTGLKAAMAGISITPLGAAISAALALGTAVWELSSKQTAGEKVLESYNSKIYTLSEWAKEATNRTADLNAEIEKSARINAEAEAKKAASSFQAVTTPSPNDWGTIELFGSSFKLQTSKKSPIEEYLDKLSKDVGSSPAAQELAKQGATLARDFIANMNDAIKSGDSWDSMSLIFNNFRTQSLSLKNQLARLPGVSEDVVSGFDKMFGSLASIAEKVLITKDGINELTNTTTDSAAQLKDFANAFDAVQKATKTSTETGKQSEAQKNVEALVTQLAKMAPVAEAAAARLQDLGTVQGYTSEQMTEDKRITDQFAQALKLVGEQAGTTGIGLSELGGFLTNLGSKLNWATGAWDKFRATLGQGISLAGSSGIQNVLSDMKLRGELAKLTSGQKAAFTGLRGLETVKGDKSAQEALLQGIKKGDVKQVADALKVSMEEAKAALDGFNKSASEIDVTKGAKSAEAAFNKVGNVIDATRTKIDAWNAKINESKPESFAVTLEKELRKLDATIASSKGTASQVAQMHELRAEMERVGRLREQQIAAEESQKAREAFTKDQKRVTSAYRKVVGEDNKDVLEAARAQYDIDAKNFKDALDKKVISYDEYSSMIKMIDTNLADTQLRSQTDLYSRLQVTADEYFKKYGDFTKGIGDVVTNAMNSSASAIAAFAVNGARDFNSLADAFNKMAESILSTVAQLLAQQAVAAMFSSIMGFFNTGGSSGLATSGQYSGSTGNRFGHAKGGAYYGGGLSSYSNTVVSTPTLFSMGTPAFAYGAGLMGEAGPEGIFPLTRIGGKLGIRAEMPQNQGTVIQQSIKINVQNNSKTQVSAQESRDNQGNVNIEMLIEEQVAQSMRRPGSGTYKAIQNNWGGTPALAQRG